MSLESSFNERGVNKFMHKIGSTCSENTKIHESSDLEGKLSSLEHQYAKMEIEYSKKIKQLRHNLADKTQKQSSLMKQITNLRNSFKEHQEQIMKISEQITMEDTRENQLKQSKKNSSPRLIKKSLENEKKLSPSSNQASKQLGKIFGQVKKPIFGASSSPGVKKQSPRISPRGNPNGIIHNLKQDIQLNIKQEKQANAHQHHSGKKQPLKTSGENRKKGFSPKSTQDVKVVLLNSMKNAKKEGTASPTNGSPRRPIRRSPGVQQKAQPKKEGKQLLGKLKQNADVEQFF